MHTLSDNPIICPLHSCCRKATETHLSDLFLFIFSLFTFTHITTTFLRPIISICVPYWYIPLLQKKLQNLTCLNSERRLLTASLLRQLLGSFLPLGASFPLLGTAFAVKTCAVLRGQDVLYEEGGQRSDWDGHFHPVIHHKPERNLSVAAAAECLLTHVHGLSLYQSRDRTGQGGTGGQDGGVTGQDWAGLL